MGRRRAVTLAALALAASGRRVAAEPASAIVIVAEPCVDERVDLARTIELLRIELRADGDVTLERRGDGEPRARHGAVALDCGAGEAEVVIRRDTARTGVPLADVAGDSRPRVLAIALAEELAVPMPAPVAAAAPPRAPSVVAAATDEAPPAPAARGPWSASLRFEGVALVDSGTVVAATGLFAHRWDRVALQAAVTGLVNLEGGSALLGGPRITLRGPTWGRLGGDVELGVEAGVNTGDDETALGFAGLGALVGRVEVSRAWDVGAQVTYRRANLGGGDLISLGLSATWHVR